MSSSISVLLVYKMRYVLPRKGQREPLYLPPGHPLSLICCIHSMAYIIAEMMTCRPRQALTQKTVESFHLLCEALVVRAARVNAVRQIVYTSLGGPDVLFLDMK